MQALTSPAHAASDRPLYYAFLAFLLWSPLPLGSNRIWAWSIMEVWVLFLAIGWLFQYLRGRVWINRAFIHALPVTSCLALTVLWMIFQAFTLPADLLGILSPKALELHTATQTATSLSLNTYATHESALKTLCYLLLFCLSLLLVTDRRRIQLLAQVILLGGVFQAGYGALMTLSGLEYGFFIEKITGQGVATGTFINRNHLAGYLEMCLAVGIGLMLSELSSGASSDWRDSVRRLLRTLLGRKVRVRLALVVMVIGLVLTHSRMGNSAFLLSLTVAGTFYLFVSRRISRGSIIFFASLLLVDLLVVGNFFGIQEVAERLQQTALATESRDNLYLDTLMIVREFPLTGTGAGSFYSVFPMYDSGTAEFTFRQHALNDYLQFASELGLPVLTLLGFSVLASLWSAIRAQLTRHDRLLQGMGFAVTMGMIALLIHSAADFNLQIPANAVMFVVLMALGWIARYWDPVASSREPRK